MVDITSILDQRCTRAALDAPSRKRALEAAADLLADGHPELKARDLFDELMARERLGSTGLGEGVAIPHCRIPCPRMLGAFVKLRRSVDYEAADGEPVDLLFVLIVPPDENTTHLEVLASLARIFNESENRTRLRDCASDTELYEQLVGLFSSQAA